MRNFTFAGVPGSPFVCLSKCLYGSLIKCTLLFLLLGGLPARLAAQDLQWAKRIGGTGSDYAQSIALDGSGNVYVVGNFSGTADFDPGSGVFNLGPATGSDVYFAKYNASGDLIWAKALIGGVTDNALGVAVSGSAVYITGTFAGVLDFDPGSGVVSRDGGTNTSYDIFIAKYSAADGSYAWVRTIGQPGASSSRGDGIAVDGSGNVYVTGSFSGSSVNFGNVSLAGGNTGFLAKYDSNNTPLWAKSITPGASGDGQHVAVDNSGSAYVTGGFAGTTDFNQDGSGILATNAPGVYSAFVAKYNATGAYQWANKIDTYGGDGFGIAVNGAGTTIAVTGRFYQSASPTFYDIYIRQYTGSGSVYNPSWTKPIGGSQTDEGFGVALDAAGNVYATGSLSSTSADFNPGGTPVTLTNSSNGALYLAKYNSGGAIQYAKGVGTNVGGRLFGLASTADGSSVYLSGAFSGTVNYSTCGGTFNMTSSGDDAFFAKYSASPLSISATINGYYAVCPSTSNTFTLQITPAGFPVSWSTSSNLVIQSSTATSITVTAASTSNGQQAWIQAATPTACTPQTFTKNVWIGAAPVASISGWPGFFCPGDLLYLTADDYVNPGTTNYTWEVIGGTLVDGQNTKYVTVRVPDNALAGSVVRVKVRAVNSCGSSVFIQQNKAVSSTCFSAMVAVYPNPASEELTVTLAGAEAPETGDVKEEAEVRLLNGQNSLVKKGATKAGKVTLRVADLPAGFYYLHVQTGQGVIRKHVQIWH